MATLLACPVDDIALPGSTGAGLSAVLSGLEVDGRTLVVAAGTFAGVAQVCGAQVARGADVVHCPVVEVPTVIRSTGAAAVLLDHVDRATGRVADLDPVLDAASRAGALSIVDCSHSLGHLSAPAADVVVGCGYKYLFGISGVAVLRVGPDVRDRIVPSSTGWFAAADVTGLHAAYEPSASASRFESGAPAFASVFALAATVEALLASTGRDVAAELRSAAERLGPPAGDHAYLVLESGLGDPAAVLRRSDVTASTVGGRLRLSPSVGNAPSELRDALGFLLDELPDLRLFSG